MGRTPRVLGGDKARTLRMCSRIVSVIINGLQSMLTMGRHMAWQYLQPHHYLYLLRHVLVVRRYTIKLLHVHTFVLCGANELSRPSEGLCTPGDSRRRCRSHAALAAVTLVAVALAGLASAAVSVSARVIVADLWLLGCCCAAVDQYIPRRGSGARLSSGLRRGRRAFRLRSTCSGGTDRDRSPACVPSGAPPGSWGCSIGPC